MNKILISVIIHCYTVETWVAEAVQACLDQAYAPIEIIVVEDGSADGSLKALSDYNDKIKLETAPNSGGNRGFALSNGEYIRFF